MDKIFNKNKKIIVRSILVFLFFYFSSYLQYIPIYLFGLDISKIKGNTNAAALLSCFSSIIVMIVFIVIYRKELRKDFKKYTDDLLDNFETGFKWYFVGLIIMMVSNLILFYIFKSGGAGNENTVQKMISASPLFMALNVCILAPFNEEIAFRKTLHDTFTNKTMFVILSFLLFGGAHVIGNSSSLVDYLYIIPYGALGGAFAIAYNKTDTAFTSIVLHALHNTCLFLLSLSI